MRRIILAVLATLFFVTSCDSDSAINPEKSKQKTKEAVKVMNETITTMQDSLSDPNCEFDCEPIVINEASDMDVVDFRNAYNLYNEAVIADPSNLDAQLGAAVTRMLSVLKHPDFIVLRNAWWGKSPTQGDFSINEEELSKERLYIESFVNQALIPAIDYSLERLAILDTEANKNYTYMITSEFTGIEDMETLELDMTEIKLFRAALFAVKGMTHLSKTYKVNLNDYSLENIKTALQKDGELLTLLDKNQGLKAYNHALLAIDKAIEALNTLLAENDDQDDDILRRTTEDLPYIQDQKDMLLEAKDILTQDYQITQNGITITLSVENFVNNLPADLKALLPDYTVMIENDTIQIEPVDESAKDASFPDVTFSGLIKETLSQDDLKLFLDIYECGENFSCDEYSHCTEDYQCEYGKACTETSECEMNQTCTEDGYCADTKIGNPCTETSECESYEICNANGFCEYNEN